MTVLPLLIVAWAVIVPAAVVGLFVVRGRSAPSLEDVRAGANRAVVETPRVCETRQRQAVVADSRRFLRHHG